MDHLVEDFAVLLSASKFTSAALRQHYRDLKNHEKSLVEEQSTRSTPTHHLKFLNCHGLRYMSTDSPVSTPGRPVTPETPGLSVTDDGTNDDQYMDEDEPFPWDSPCYVLSLDKDRAPTVEASGFVIGTGDFDTFPEDGGVDLLLPPVCQPSKMTCSRQAYFTFDKRYGQLWLQARHSGISIGSRKLGRNERAFLQYEEQLCIGPFRFTFQHVVQEEAEFMEIKRDYLASLHPGYEIPAVTSATPRPDALQINGWVFRGIIGASHTTDIYAVTHSRKGITIAAKKLRFTAATTKGQHELSVYQGMLRDIKGHDHRKFLMRLYRHLEPSCLLQRERDVFLLLGPLVLGDFSSFMPDGKWQETSHSVKKTLFVQIMLGVRALHKCGWIHRDLKPRNLGVVQLSPHPHAVVLDMGQAIRTSTYGHIPRPGACGTVGYQAPELQNRRYSERYTEMVDIWSLGATAHCMFRGPLPWSGVEKNIFLDEEDQSCFTDYRQSIDGADFEDLEFLLHRMLDPDPATRTRLKSVLAHPYFNAVWQRESAAANVDAQASHRQSRWL